ncbi:glycosyltransferase family 4 protein [Actinocorallia libanotica]|uniref:Glycosyltransferase family 4 protein n=1 Tax=Actinocorallia libanotica TaxID=46162 RepID=A0ABP4CCJ1_9ACTN
MTSRPVVAVVVDAVHPFSFGGRENRYRELSGHLSERFELHVYTMNWWKGPSVREEDGLTFHALCRHLPLYRGGSRSTLQALWFAVACLRLLWRRFDVLEADQIPFFPVLALRLVATLRRRPLVGTWHEVWGPEYWRDYLGRAWRLGWWVERAAMRAPDRIIAASAETAGRLESHLGGRTPVTVAPNGIDLARVAAAEPADEPCDLVAVSRLMPHKRLDLLLEAVAMLHALDRPVTCRIIGDGPDRERLHRRAAELGISAAVDFRHDVREQKDVYSLIKAGRVFAFPSVREGFGVAALEALACGVPVVTTSARDNLAQFLVARSRDGIVCAPHLADFTASLMRGLAGGAERPSERAPEPWLAEYEWSLVADRVTEVLRDP